MRIEARPLPRRSPRPSSSALGTRSTRTSSSARSVTASLPSSAVPDLAEERSDHHVELVPHRLPLAVAQHPVDDERDDCDLQEQEGDIPDEETPHLVVKRRRGKQRPPERVQQRRLPRGARRGVRVSDRREFIELLSSEWGIQETGYPYPSSSLMRGSHEQRRVRLRIDRSRLPPLLSALTISSGAERRPPARALRLTARPSSPSSAGVPSRRARSNGAKKDQAGWTATVGRMRYKRARRDRRAGCGDREVPDASATRASSAEPTQRAYGESGGSRNVVAPGRTRGRERRVANRRPRRRTACAGRVPLARSRRSPSRRRCPGIALRSPARSKMPAATAGTSSAMFFDRRTAMSSRPSRGSAPRATSMSNCSRPKLTMSTAIPSVSMSSPSSSISNCDIVGVGFASAPSRYAAAPSVAFIGWAASMIDAS